jgi:hypothetical protein
MGSGSNIYVKEVKVLLNELIWCLCNFGYDLYEPHISMTASFGCCHLFFIKLAHSKAIHGNMRQLHIAVFHDNDKLYCMNAIACVFLENHDGYSLRKRIHSL